jgi:hypothetical protein
MPAVDKEGGALYHLKMEVAYYLLGCVATE